MKNNNSNPIVFERKLGYSIIESTEYRTLK